MECITSHVCTYQNESLKTFMESFAAHLNLAELVYLVTVRKDVESDTLPVTSRRGSLAQFECFFEFNL